jgi:hypothetical protein
VHDGPFSPGRTPGANRDGCSEGFGPDDTESDRSPPARHRFHDLRNSGSPDLGGNPRHQPTDEESPQGRSQEAKPPRDPGESLQRELGDAEDELLDDSDQSSKAYGGISDQQADDHRGGDDERVLTAANLGKELIEELSDLLAESKHPNGERARRPAGLPACTGQSLTICRVGVLRAADAGRQRAAADGTYPLVGR